MGRDRSLRNQPIDSKGEAIEAGFLPTEPDGSLEDSDAGYTRRVSERPAEVTAEERADVKKVLEK